MARLRGFEIAKGWEDKDIHLPKRATRHSAAYDIEAGEDVVIPAFQLGMKPALIQTGLKAYCQPDEYYIIANRSSNPKRGLVLANGIGVIDADYYGNPDNDGAFVVVVFNVSGQEITIKKGERIAQVIFQKFLTVDGDVATGQRQGGYGSTG